MQGARKRSLEMRRAVPTSNDMLESVMRACEFEIAFRSLGECGEGRSRVAAKNADEQGEISKASSRGTAKNFFSSGHFWRLPTRC